MINKKFLLILVIIQFIFFMKFPLKSSDNIIPSEKTSKEEIKKSKIASFIQKIKENPKKAIFLSASTILFLILIYRKKFYRINKINNSNPDALEYLQWGVPHKKILNFKRSLENNPDKSEKLSIDGISPELTIEEWLKLLKEYEEVEN